MTTARLFEPGSFADVILRRNVNVAVALHDAEKPKPRPVARATNPARKRELTASERQAAVRPHQACPWCGQLTAKNPAVIAGPVPAAT